MPYVLAPRWKGQVLPPGVLGYPKSHPNVYSYARPRYVKGRGFLGLGDLFAPCTTANTPGCNFFDLFVPSDSCIKAMDACAVAPGGPAALSLTPAPSAGPISTAELVQQTQAPTGSNVSPDAAAALTAYQTAVAAANACPAGTTPQLDGTCAAPSSGMPWWGWAILAGVGLLAVLK